MVEAVAGVRGGLATILGQKNAVNRIVLLGNGSRESSDARKKAANCERRYRRVYFKKGQKGTRDHGMQTIISKKRPSRG